MAKEAGRRIYATSDLSRIVDENDPDAGVLVMSDSSQYDRGEVVAYFGEPFAKVVDAHMKANKKDTKAAEPADTDEAEGADTKAESPRANKAEKPAANKGA